MKTKFNRQTDETEIKNEVPKTKNTVTQALINARKASGLTQKQLSIKTGINQSDISKIENGNANPSISTLKRLANAMDMKLKIEFIPD